MGPIFATLVIGQKCPDFDTILEVALDSTIDVSCMTHCFRVLHRLQNDAKKSEVSQVVYSCRQVLVKTVDMFSSHLI